MFRMNFRPYLPLRRMRKGLQSPEILTAGDLSTQPRVGCMLPACGQKGLELKKEKKRKDMAIHVLPV